MGRASHVSVVGLLLAFTVGCGPKTSSGSTPIPQTSTAMTTTALTTSAANPSTAKAPTTEAAGDAWKPLPLNGFDGIPLVLAPVGDPIKEKRPEANIVWQGLVKGVLEDPESQKLLQKLMNCAAVELVQLDNKPADDFRPPPAKTKPAIYLAIYLDAGQPAEARFKGCYRGAGSFFGFEVPPTRNWTSKASGWDAFVLAANEYLHRNKKGYQLHQGVFFEPDQIPAEERDSALRGAYLEKKIQQFLSHYPK
jgi:hypothetical protein